MSDVCPASKTGEHWPPSGMCILCHRPEQRRNEDEADEAAFAAARNEPREPWEDV
jgi:hypothetical protein